MAHPEQVNFCKRVKGMYPAYFKNKKVLDCGSLDINGNNRYLFEDCDYLGVDIGPGRNVDVVSTIHELNYPDGSFDVIISTECFEHDMFYEQSIRNICRLLRPGGMFLFTCATTGRPEHGTSRSMSGASPLTSSSDEEWKDYYKNLEEADIRNAVDVDRVFLNYGFSTNDNTFDLYFWGVKKGQPMHADTDANNRRHCGDAPESLDALATLHGVDKAHSCHDYARFYDSLLKPIRHAARRVLEIGCYNGDSLRMWRDYFDCAMIYGVEIRPDRAVSGPWIKTYIGDQTDEAFLAKVPGTFDVIVDDGSHLSRDQIRTFEIMFKRVNSGGFYIVEDTSCSYWIDFTPGNGPTAVEYFKSLVDHVNMHGFSVDGKFDRNRDLLLQHKADASEWERTIDYIIFYNSAIVIKKI